MPAPTAQPDDRGRPRPDADQIGDLSQIRLGTRFADYELIKEIGHGAMSRVIAARHLASREIHAIKVLDPSLSQHEHFIRQFVTEGRATAKLRHENIVRVFDVGIYAGIYYIAMEYIRGRNLRGVLGNNAKLFTPRLAARIIRDVCRGLEHAWEHGVIHRDVKLDNIMIDADKIVKILDFGLALDIEGETGIGASPVCGSPNYISPEQARGQAVDFRTDMYSLGVCFYHMTTGRFPFIARDTHVLLERHVKETPKPPALINPQISSAVQAVILKMLAKSPALRHLTFGELIADLDAIVDGKVPPSVAAENAGTSAPPRADESQRRKAVGDSSVIEIEGHALEQILALDDVRDEARKAISESQLAKIPSQVLPAVKQMLDEMDAESGSTASARVPMLGEEIAADEAPADDFEDDYATDGDYEADEEGATESGSWPPAPPPPQDEWAKSSQRLKAMMLDLQAESATLPDAVPATPAVSSPVPESVAALASRDPYDDPDRTALAESGAENLAPTPPVAPARDETSADPGTGELDETALPGDETADAPPTAGGVPIAGKRPPRAAARTGGSPDGNAGTRRPAAAPPPPPHPAASESGEYGSDDDHDYDEADDVDAGHESGSGRRARIPVDKRLRNRDSTARKRPELKPPPNSLAARGKIAPAGKQKRRRPGDSGDDDDAGDNRRPRPAKPRRR